MKQPQSPLAYVGQVSLVLMLMNLPNAWADTAPTSATTATTTDAAIANTAKDELFIDNLIRNGIQPLYRELEQSSQQLSQSTDEFCKETSLGNLQKLRDAWGNTMLAWQRTDALLFGPATTDQLDFQINFAPPKKQIVKGLLASDKPLSAEAVAAAGVGAQGLSTFEYLLFDREQSTEQMLTSFQGDAGKIRCSYVQAVSQLLEQNIKKVSTPWLSDDAAKFFTNNQEMIDVLIGKAYQSLERINLKKISLPLGLNDEQHTTHPYDLEAWRSGYSFKIIKANVDGLRRVYVDGGFLTWIDKNFPSEATKTAVVSFAKQLTDFEQMKLPDTDPFVLVENYKTPTPEIGELIERVRGLEMGVKRQLSVLAKAQLGFNDGDGD